MGTMTHLELVTEALELAGNTGLATRAQAWLGLVLRHLVEKFQFPQQKAAGYGGTLTTSGIIQVGGPAADIAADVTVRGIRRVLIATLSTLDDYTELDLVTDGNFQLPGLNDAVRTGRPLTVFSTPEINSFLLGFSPTPDKSYRVLVTVDSASWSPYVYSAAEVSAYPDDLTMIQGIYAMALKHQQDERAAAEWAEFRRMASEDRVRYGNMNRANVKIPLTGPHVVRNRQNRGPGWMGPV